MNYIDLKYINLVSHRLLRFKKKTSSEYNFRCPFCGDSFKSESKARGWLLEKKGECFFYCHNCNISKNFYTFLNTIDVGLSKEYYFEKFKSNLGTEDIGGDKSLEKLSFPKPIFKTRSTDILEERATSLRDLPRDHIAIKYVESRKIPRDEYENLYYIDKFNILDPSSSIKDERLIIPYYGTENKLVGFTGRALRKSNLRYINISYDDEKLFYGTRHIDKTKDVYVVEGAIDSMFLRNSIAVNNSNLARVTSIAPQESCILIPDREPRNKVIVNNIYNFIEKGFRVCLLPSYVKGKDINEYILNGLDPEDLMDIINANIVQGMIGRLKLTEWKGI